MKKFNFHDPAINMTLKNKINPPKNLSRNARTQLQKCKSHVNMIGQNSYPSSGFNGTILIFSLSFEASRDDKCGPYMVGYFWKWQY